jgi:hypothetical protein
MLAISVGMFVLGSAVCIPGPCGCTSWIEFSHPVRFFRLFAILSLVGELGTVVGFSWLLIVGAWQALRQKKES